MRDHQPVIYDEAGGTWQVFRYEDALRISSDPAIFSNELQRMGPLQRFTRGNIGAMDPPKHCRVRTLVSQAFTARTISDLAGRVTELTGELLDVVVGRDEFDLVGDFSFPLPVIVIAELLGVPATDRDLFRGWVDAMLAPTYKRLTDLLEEQELMSAYAALEAYLLEHVRDRQRSPKDDLISRLTQAQGDEGGLDDEEVVGFASFLLLGGRLTITVLLANAVRCLHEHPAADAELRADRTLIPTAIEEVLRYRSPFLPERRVTTCDVTLGDRVVPASSLITASLLSANHDERRFLDPDTFEIRRDPNPHLAFGHGAHFCLGAPLARMVGAIALNLLFDRFPLLRLKPGAGIPMYGSPEIFGPSRMLVSTS
ncbi:MAG: cytochrome P450 [Pseudonocardiaceae bacterium]